MPQADMYYSAELALDARAILAQVEAVIAAHDDTSGACKGRAHRITDSHHTHVLLRLKMLNKPHRDDAFMQALLEKLQAALAPQIPPAILGIELEFLSRHYASTKTT